MVSGIAGYLASSVFSPFRAEVGPAGSLYGVLACFIVQILKEWSFLEQPWKILAKMIGVVIFLFLIGLFPWIDNYAHIVGFAVGFLLSIALIPDFTIGSKPNELNPNRKIIQIVVCLSTVFLLIITFFVLLYHVPIYDIPFLKHLNCLPLTKDWCAIQEIVINRMDVF